MPAIENASREGQKGAHRFARVAVADRPGADDNPSECQYPARYTLNKLEFSAVCQVCVDCLLNIVIKRLPFELGPVGGPLADNVNDCVSLSGRYGPGNQALRAFGRAHA